MSLYRKNLDWNDSTCKISKNLGDNILSLPLYPSLKISQAKYICDKVSEFLKTKILFRCDLGDINELGSGHFYRCITIARFLKLKFKLKFKDIIFCH